MTLRLIILLACLIAGGPDDGAVVRIFLAGDSTMADKPLTANPERGWGQMLPAFLSPQTVVFNHAKNGRSTRSFQHEGRWDALLSKLRTGDHVFIQFGHNDSKREDTARFADARGDYRKNLVRFVNDVRSRGGIPVLLTPVVRRNFTDRGAFVDKHGEYPDVVREVAKETGAALIDLHRSSRAKLEELGDERSKALFLLSVPAGRYAALPGGKTDNTHFTRTGAMAVAKLAADGIRSSGLPLAAYVTDAPPLPEGRWTVGLDQFYNNERKRIGDTASVRYHYTWNDTADSGFSELAALFDRSGGDLDTLSTAPTREALAALDVYIIVDPDTPKESPSPNTMQDAEAAAIEEWVRGGGTLLLFSNDRGNAEFERFNSLAERFGLRFNGDSYQDVKNNRYDDGRVTALPAHPLFEGVEHLFLKQVTTIDCRGAAAPVLTLPFGTVIAESRAGRGRVLAVGDPWLYNEYLDNRRLPAGYENRRAAEQLVRWVRSDLPLRH